MNNTTTTFNKEESAMHLVETGIKYSKAMIEATERLHDMYGFSFRVSLELGMIEVDGGMDDETRGAEAYAYRTLRVFGDVSSMTKGNITRQFVMVNDGEVVIAIQTRMQ